MSRGLPSPLPQVRFFARARMPRPRVWRFPNKKSDMANTQIYDCNLRNLKQLLGDLDNIAERLDILNPSLYGICMARLRGVQDILDLLNLAVCPILVHRPTICEDSVEDTEQAECYHGFFIQDVELIADCIDGNAGTGR
jgi:hypothetical protein